MKPSPPTTLSDVQLTGLRNQPPAPQKGPGLLVALKRRRAFLITVVAPLLLLAVALFGVISDRYVVESRFAIRSRGGGAGDGAQSESSARGAGESIAASLAVRDYLMSLDALATLRKDVDIVSIWRAPESDALTQLWNPEAPAEKLLSYYNRMIDVSIDTTSGLAVVRVEAYRAGDALQINEKLLQMAEAMVNHISLRAREDQLALMRREVKVAEERVRNAQEAIIRFRQTEQQVDPSASALTGQSAIAALEATLSTTRATLNEQLAYMRPDNPQVQNTRNRIAALEAQILKERAQITQGQGQGNERAFYRGNESLPAQLAAYERLQMERDFAAKQLDSATASLEAARIEVARQQVYLARVVQPMLAEYPTEPRRFFILASAALILLVLFGLGWLIVSGVREHGN